MSDSHGDDFRQKKALIRQWAHANRNQQPNKDELSRHICNTFMGLPEFEAARTVLFYVDVRSEVRTRHALPEALRSSKRIVVPYCADNELELFALGAMEELVVGRYTILEPRNQLRSMPDRKVMPRELDLVMVPGVAFDRSGGRLGHGLGYFDKLLQQTRPNTSLVALAFECQLFTEIPVEVHDVFMHKIITERAIYSCLRKKNRSEDVKIHLRQATLCTDLGETADVAPVNDEISPDQV